MAALLVAVDAPGRGSAARVDRVLDRPAAVAVARRTPVACIRVTATSTAGGRDMLFILLGDGERFRGGGPPPGRATGCPHGSVGVFTPARLRSAAA